jgi:hypothetical protein
VSVTAGKFDVNLSSLAAGVYDFEALYYDAQNVLTHQRSGTLEVTAAVPDQQHSINVLGVGVQQAQVAIPDATITGGVDESGHHFYDPPGAVIGWNDWTPICGDGWAAVQDGTDEAGHPVWRIYSTRTKTSAQLYGTSAPEANETLIKYRAVGTSTWHEVTTGPGNWSFDISNFAAGTTYEYQVLSYEYDWEVHQILHVYGHAEGSVSVTAPSANATTGMCSFVRRRTRT